MHDNYTLLKQNNLDIYQKVKDISIDLSKYELISTREGLLTVKINSDETFYLHSKYNPKREAQKFIDENYNDDCKNYLVYGLGFGYHIEELLEKSNDIYINIIESNIYILKLALDNINLKNILENPRVNLYLGEDILSFKNVFDKAKKLPNHRFILHSSSIKAISSEMKQIKYLLEEFKIKRMSLKNNKYDLDGNFEYNKANYDEFVNILFNKFNNKPIILVSAGPSLDKNKHILKEVGDKATIICVGRSVRTLVKIGVAPDFIIITDPQEFVYQEQLEGLDIDIPIIILSTCDKNVMKNYKGQKYIALQNGYERAEEHAKSLGLELIETGGSVATTALDISIKMGANPIIFVGQDLAYDNGQTHSKDATYKPTNTNTKLRKVIGIDGKELSTSKTLNIYLRWIENKIQEEKNKQFIDATEGGAKITGTKVMELKKVINNLKY